MGRSVEPLDVENLVELPLPCGRCVQWLMDPVEAALPGSDPCGHTAAAQERKADWVRDVTRKWGPPGVVLREDGVVVGHLGYAPPAHVERAAAFATAPISRDAVLLLGMVAPEAPQARRLIQGAAADLVRRRVPAIEAFGGPDGVPGCRTQPGEHLDAACRLPTHWLEELGFRVVRTHQTTPRLRLDLSTALRLHERVLLGVLGQVRRKVRVVEPAPAPGLGSRLGTVVDQPPRKR